jgi:uncharacterized membrane protein YvlD (DUF360 family)
MSDNFANREQWWRTAGDSYRAQFRLFWEWRRDPAALSARWLTSVGVAAIGFALTAWLVPGITVTSVLGATVAVLLISLVHAVIRPFFLAIAASVSAISVGLLAITLQAVVVLVMAPVAPGVSVDDFAAAAVGSLVFASSNTALTLLVGIDTDQYQSLLLRRLALSGNAARTNVPGVVIIQIDGLAHSVLAARIRAGQLPTLASWLRSGSHRLARWEALLPSMTSASQAGILYGNNDEIPAFRWYERSHQRVMVSSNPGDAAEISRRVSSGQGLLSEGGASIGNLLPGDAARSFVTTATLADPSLRFGDGRAFYGFFENPGVYLRSFVMFAAEIVKDRLQTRRSRLAGVWPRIDRGIRHATKRAISNVVLRDLNVSLVIEEMSRATSAVYVDFTDYDEIAHYSGPERVEALEALDGIDAAIGTIARAAAHAPRPYRFIVLSDHGQSLGASFSQRYGESLATIVSTAIALPSDLRPDGTAAELTARRDRDVPVKPTAAVVLGSGNLGLIYFRGSDRRLTLEEIEDRCPGLVSSLLSHPGVGLLLIRTGTAGGVILGATGARYLDDDRIRGHDPTDIFGPNAIDSLRREDAMLHAPDILVLSQYDPDTGEVAAFEEQIGSHGGLGGPQTQAFILHPSDWHLQPEVPIGAPAIYRNMRQWFRTIGIHLGSPSGTTSGGTK